MPRVIGKKGALIRELRQESGATIEILDRPPAVPEILQRNEQRVARIRGSDAAMHSAVVGLIRNAIGPEVMRDLDPAGQRENEVLLLIPTKSVSFLNDPKILDGTDCTLHASPIEGMRRHRRVHVANSGTKDLQIVAWRIHALILHLARSQVLTDQDFDLQDSAWDIAMEAFQRTRQSVASAANPSEVGGTQVPPRSQSSAVSLEHPSKIPEALALEAEAHRAREAREREMQDARERERKARAREVQAREARERYAQAYESRTLAEKARETWARAAQAQGNERDALSLEAQRCAAQARDAQERSLTKAAAVPLSQLGSQCTGGPPSVTPGGTTAAAEGPRLPPAPAGTAGAADAPAVPAAQGPTDADNSQFCTGEAACGAQLGGMPEGRTLDSGPLVGPPRGRESVARWEREALERQAPRRQEPWQVVPESAAQETRARRRDTLEPVSVGRSQRALPEPPTVSAVVEAGQANAACESELLISLPNASVVDFLISAELGIDRRAGVKLTVCRQPHGFSVLQICGPPVANAIACYLVQEALWMRGAFRR